ncbi:MAG: PD40 domain-containing protein [Verrucomicrobia bacterium]|nr:PD40 domain-containing protein [Verrucomicrobiota bacterium]
MKTETLLATLEGFTGWLLQTSWQASVLIGLVLLSQGLLRNHLSAGWRYGLWLLVLVRLMLPAPPPSPFSLHNFLPPFLASTVHAQRAVGDYRSAAGTEVASVSLSSAPESNPSTVPPPRTDGLGNISRLAAPKASAPSVGNQLRAPDVEPAPRSTASWHWALSLIWLTGAALLLARVVWIPFRLNARLARLHSAASPAALEILEEAQQCMGMRRVLPIVQSAAVSSPALMGFIRPWLLLPEGMAARFTPQELRFVFLHELAHLKRRDIAVNWLMTLLQILHWFNPLVWFAFSRMRADRELACDALALSRAGDGEKEAYGETVIKVLESFIRPAPMAGLVGILEDKQQMKRRIGMIAQYKESSPWSTLAPAVLLALCLVSLTDAQTEKQAEALAGRSADQTASQIVSDAAKAASKKMPEQAVQGLTLRKVPYFPSDVGFARNVSRDGRFILGADYPLTWTRWILDLATGEKRQIEPNFETSLFTPDGKKIVGSRRFGGPKAVLLLDLQTQKLQELYQSEDLEDIGFFMDCSADGQNILAVFYKKDKTTELVSVSMSGGALRVLKRFKTDASVPDVAFSPDGRWVAYVSGKDIHLIAADGSREGLLIEHPADDRLLGWAPFGDQILFASDRRGTWDAFMIHVADGKPVGEAVLVKASLSGWRPAFTNIRSGTGFTQTGAFFYMSEMNVSEVYVAALDPVSGKIQGNPIKAAGKESPNEHPAWSRDSRFLAYITRQGGSFLQDGFIRIRNMETGAIRELSTDAGRVSFPHWSPDGKSVFAIAYRPSRRAYRIDIESGKSAVLWEKLTSLWYGSWPVWSWAPDGKSFFQQKGPKIMTRHDVDTSAKLDSPIPQNSFSTVLSPTCELLVFSVTETNGSSLSRTINVASLKGGETRQLVELVGSEAIDSVLRVGFDTGLGWTPDSRYVLFVKGNPNNSKARALWRVPAAGGEPEALGLEMDELRTPVISPDGRWIAFVAGGDKTDLWVMENFLPAQKTAAK